MNIEPKTEDEEKLIDCYRSMSKDKQKKLFDFAGTLVEKNRKNKIEGDKK